MDRWFRRTNNGPNPAVHGRTYSRSLSSDPQQTPTPRVTTGARYRQSDDVSVSGVRLRVLQFTWRLSLSGGVPQTERQPVRGLNKQEFDVHLCTVRPTACTESADLDDVEIHSLGLKGGVSIPQKASLIREFGKLVRRVQPDV